MKIHFIGMLVRLHLIHIDTSLIVSFSWWVITH